VSRKASEVKLPPDDCHRENQNAGNGELLQQDTMEREYRGKLSYDDSMWGVKVPKTHIANPHFNIFDLQIPQTSADYNYTTKLVVPQ
jgi:hypothetical protein